jgi:ADP-ribosylglycohydrolase
LRDKSHNCFQGAFVGCLVGNVLGSYSEKLTRTEILETTEGRGITGFGDRESFLLRSDLPFRSKPTEAFFLPAALAESIIVNGGYYKRESLRHQFLMYLERGFIHEGANSRSFAKLAKHIDETGNFTEEFGKFAAPENPDLSNGNGVAKRVWPLGLFFSQSDKFKLSRQFMDIVLGEGFCTHWNVLASIGAYAVVRLVHSLLRNPANSNERHFFDALEYTSEMERTYGLHYPTDKSLVQRIQQTAHESWEQERVSGFTMESIPFIFHVFMDDAPDFRTGLLRVLNAGGSTCANGALMGAILGAKFGAKGIPTEWCRAVIHQRAAVSLGTGLYKASRNQGVQPAVRF